MAIYSNVNTTLVKVLFLKALVALGLGWAMAITALMAAVPEVRASTGIARNNLNIWLIRLWPGYKKGTLIR